MPEARKGADRMVIEQWIGFVLVLLFVGFVIADLTRPPKPGRRPAKPPKGKGS